MTTGIVLADTAGRIVEWDDGGVARLHASPAGGEERGGHPPERERPHDRAPAARQEWTLFGAMRRAAPGRATTWWVGLVLRGALPPRSPSCPGG